MQAKQLELLTGSAGICVVDTQERLAGSMPEKVIKGTLRNCLNLIEAARVLRLPIVVTEQFPDGVGRTLPVVAEAVLRLPKEQTYFHEKLRFSCVGERGFQSWLRRSGRMQWVVAGMETHIAVYQMARDLCRAGHAVHVPRDAVVSRTMANWEIGLQLCSAAGALVTSTEAVVFDLLKEAGSEAFQSLSQIIK